MARLEGKPSVKMEICLILTEEEAHALRGLVTYGADSFLRQFPELLGGSLAGHEVGLRSLFESVRTGDANVSIFLQRAADARDVINGKKPK